MKTTSMEPVIVRTLPWGEEIYLEIALHKNSANKFYARHGKTEDDREYIEFSKFGPKPNTEGEYYMQKLRLFSPQQWVQIKHYVEHDLADSIGWNIKAAEKEFEPVAQEEEQEVEEVAA